MSGCGCEIEITDKEQKGTLITLLAINGFMFVFEIGLGWYAQSTGLIADSLDMLADAIVYAIGIYAIGKSLLHKANAALLSGYFQAALGLMILLDIIRRIFVGSEPVSLLMMVVGVIARRFVLARIIFDSQKSLLLVQHAATDQQQSQQIGQLRLAWPLEQVEQRIEQYSVGGRM